MALLRDRCRELANNLSEDLVRDFEEKWWNACRKVCAPVGWVEELGHWDAGHAYSQG